MCLNKLSLRAWLFLCPFLCFPNVVCGRERKYLILLIGDLNLFNSRSDFLPVLNQMKEICYEPLLIEQDSLTRIATMFSGVY
jgi:hypothetical protein